MMSLLLSLYLSLSSSPSAVAMERLRLQQFHALSTRFSPRKNRRYSFPFRSNSSLQFNKECLNQNLKDNSRTSLEGLPHDILVELFCSMDVESVLSMAKVSRILRTISRTYLVWKYLAIRLMLQGRPLVLDGFVSLSTLPLPQLRRAVIRTARLYYAWASPSSPSTPKRLDQSHVAKLSFPISECLCYIVKFKNFLLPPTRDGRLLGWDFARRTFLGTYDMGNTNTRAEGRAGGLIFSGRVHYESKSLYYIVSRGFIPGRQELGFYVLHIQFLDEKGISRILYRPVAEFSLPYAYIIEMHILDAARHMLCVVLLNPVTTTLALFVVSDWEDMSKTALLSTGLSYQYRKTIISLRLSSDGDHIILCAECNDVETWHFYALSSVYDTSSNSEPAWKRVFSPSAVRSSTSLSQLTYRPESVKTYNWSDSILPSTVNVTTEPLAYRVWNMLPWWPVFKGVQYYTSTVVLYMYFATTMPQTQTRVWRVVQHFATDDGPCVVRCKPSSEAESNKADIRQSGDSERTLACPSGLRMQSRSHTLRRTTITLHDPVMVPFGDDGVPIMGLAYNHVAWIEQEEVSSSRGLRLKFGSNFGIDMGVGPRATTKRRVVKIASFPEPVDSAHIPTSPLLNSPPESSYDQLKTYPTATCGEERMCSNSEEEGNGVSVKTLDIPPRILDSAVHLVVDATDGTVSITTKGDEIHRFSYA